MFFLFLHYRIAKQVDVVLFSHCDLPHLGAYPYARSHLGMTCPVYSTIPIVNMGRICMYDLYQAKTDELDFKTFSLEDVDNAFDKITSLRFSQPTALTGKMDMLSFFMLSSRFTHIKR